MQMDKTEGIEKNKTNRGGENGMQTKGKQGNVFEPSPRDRGHSPPEWS